MSGKISGDATVPFKSSLFVPAVDMSLGVGAQNVKLLASSLLPGSVFAARDFGAVGDGLTDDTAAIQAAINAVSAAGGGAVQFGLGNFKISSTLTIGNGTASAASTQAGVMLQGVCPVAAPALFTGYTTPAPTRITWAGGAASIISIRGPIQGWGVKCMALDGGGIATNGILVTSGQFGDSSDLAIRGCVTSGISSTTVPLFAGVNNTDSLYNSWRNISIMCLPGMDGIILTGYTSSSDTDLNQFENILIGLPASGATSHGIYLQNCDTNQFVNVLMAGGNPTSRGVLFDYTASAGNILPGGNSFVGIDTNGSVLGANQFLNSGTPSQSARPNYIRGLNRANSATNPTLVNLYPDLPVSVGPNVFVQTQTASIGPTLIFTPYEFGIYRISLYLAIQSTGNNVTVTASVGWNDGAARSFTTPGVNLSTGANNPQMSVITIINVANLGLNYQTTVSGAPGAGSYMLGIVIERLS